MFKQFSIGLLCLCYSAVSLAQKKGVDLNLENESDMAIYMMLYQIGLKERKEKLLGDHSCISFSRDKSGSAILSFGINTDAFKTGTVDFNNDNDGKYSKTKSTLASLFQFFDEAKYNPEIGLRSYADPQPNIMSKYAAGSAFEKKHGKNLFGSQSTKDPRFNTDSKRRNYLLAYDRGQAFIGNFFPDNLKNKVSTTPYNSYDLEDSNRGNKECSNRRRVVVDMKFSPNFQVTSRSGAFVPAFNVASGSANYENILAAAFDAETKSLKDLPSYCQNGSTQQFLNRSKSSLKQIRTDLSKPTNVALIKSIIETQMTPQRVEKTCSFLKGAQNEKCHADNQQFIASFKAYEKDPNDFNMYSLLASLTHTSDPVKRRAVSFCAPASSEPCKNYQAFVSNFQRVSGKMKDGHTERNSSHFMDCFSNKLYYQKELQKNSSQYLFPVVKMRDPQTGEVKIDLGPENIPETKKGKGFVCQECGNGLKLKDDHLEYTHRANSDHTVTQRSDSVNGLQGIMQNKSSQNMYLMGQQKGLSVYIIKGCDVSNLDEVSKTAEMVSLIDLKEKKVKVGPTDCIFKPNVINSCVHNPAGEGDGDDDNMTYTSTVASFLTGKNLEVSLKSSVNVLDELLSALKTDYINSCQMEDFKDSPDEIIKNVLCENRGIHIPKATAEALADCPELTSSVSSK